VGAPRTTTYAYNAFNQLLDATDPDGVTLFTWDDNGNQTAKTAPGGAATGYTWDARDRLSEIALPDGTTAQYGYDTENLRVSMDDADDARRVVLDGLEEWGEVDEGSGELEARFDHDPTRIDALLAQDGASGRAAMLTDALGSVYGLADDTATLRARYGYDVYGERSATLEEIGTRWGFQGRSHASNGETISFRRRFRDPTLADFIAVDPAQTGPDGPNLYWFVRQRPTQGIDPLGTSTIFAGGSCYQEDEYLFVVGADMTNLSVNLLAGTSFEWELLDTDGNTVGEGVYTFPYFSISVIAAIESSPSSGGPCAEATPGLVAPPMYGMASGEFTIYLEAMRSSPACRHPDGPEAAMASTMLHEWVHLLNEAENGRGASYPGPVVPKAGWAQFADNLDEWSAYWAEQWAFNPPTLQRSGFD
jgi:RHS repeat-associated protein